jgi:hypothetical protein
VLARAGSDDKNPHEMNDLEAAAGLHGTGSRRGSISLTRLRYCA